MQDYPFITIVTVVKDDVWSLTKTMRSIFTQSFKDFEYIVIDGASTDGTKELIKSGPLSKLVTGFVSEPDTGVYNAMNKGLKLAKGEFVCFLNANDTFADDYALEKVHSLLANSLRDGILGWGRLNDDIWASWIEDEAFKLSSLGFCHQSLFVKRSLLLTHLFDERPFKTDSDTRQLGSLYASGANIEIIPEVLIIRGGDKGISADMVRTKKSIENTIIEEYPSLSDKDIEKIVSFRRQCSEPEYICKLLSSEDKRLRLHLAYMVLDTLFKKSSSSLNHTEIEKLFQSICYAIGDKNHIPHTLDRLFMAQSIRYKIISKDVNNKKSLKLEINKFESEEKSRIEKVREANAKVSEVNSIDDFVISLTSFPKRIPTLHFVIQSLLEQTCRPKEIHLWLGEDEIPSKKWLPGKLLELEQHGLRIFIAKRTCHQYDKFLHNSHENRTKPFIIVDDDVIYPPTSLACLLEGHKNYPNTVISNRCHLMGISQDGFIEPYNTWKREVTTKRPTLRVIATGAGGVLYPTGFLNHDMVTRVGDILANAPYADDIWLKVCTLAQGIPTLPTSLSQEGKWYHRYTPTMKIGALHATNVDLGLNDMQLQRCLNWLTNVKPTWREELIADLKEEI